MNDFLSWCRHLLVPFLFHDMTTPVVESFPGCHGGMGSLLVHVSDSLKSRVTTRCSIIASTRLWLYNQCSLFYTMVCGCSPFSVNNGGSHTQ